MDRKICSGCKVPVDVSEFSNNKTTKDGLQDRCKKCNKEFYEDNKCKILLRMKLHRENNPHLDKIHCNRYRSTPVGFLRRAYRNMSNRSIRKWGVSPSFSFVQLKDKFINSRVFVRLLKAYIDSGMKRDLAPSFDRIDDSKGYSFDNIQLMEWRENDRKGVLSRMKPVTAINIKTGAELYFESMSEAFRKTGVPTGKISNRCNRDKNIAGGYRWAHA